MKPIDYDPKVFTDIETHAKDIKSKYSQRDQDFSEYEDAFLCRWPEAGNAKFKRNKARVVINPDPRNRLRGAIQLMTSTNPQVNIVNTSNQKKVDEKLEKSINRMLEQSGRRAGIPIHHDMITSSLLYSEMHTGVTLTSDILTLAQNIENAAETDIERKYARANRERAEETYAYTPVLIDNFRPLGAYPEMDDHGLSAYYRIVDMSVGDVINRFGYMPKQWSDKSRYDKVKLHVFYDTVYSVAWVEGTPVMFQPRENSLIPIHVQLTDGTMLFDKPEEQRQPLLYTLMKSGLYDQLNLSVTVMYTMIYTLGTNPIFVFRRSPTSGNRRAADIMSFDTPGGVWELEPGEELAPVKLDNIITDAIREGLTYASQKVDESTIYPQSLGAPVEGVDTFSELSLLATSGRLPLIGTKTRGGWGISGVIELALRMLKQSRQKYESNGMVIFPADIPSNVQVDTKLEIDLPQDKLQLANIANILKDRGFVSDEWIQTNILSINQPREMRREVMKDQARIVLFQEALKKALMEFNPPNPQLPGGVSGVEGAPQVDTGNAMEPTPDMTAGPMMTPEQGEQVQGIPPQMAGMMPGVGQGIAPGPQEPQVR